MGPGGQGPLLLLHLTLTLSLPDRPANPAPCSHSRQILTDDSGIISDGPAEANYTENTHCQWLIRPKSRHKYISIQFTRLATECSYDYVFLRDGDSLDSPLLGSFSGRSLPLPVLATSGSLLVILYSDTNYALEGFAASYSAHPCPHNCSSRGECLAGVCQCAEGWAGTACARPACPNRCGEGADWGACQREATTGALGCRCSPGFVGDDCSLNEQNFIGNTWSLASQEGEGRLPPRTLQTATYDPDSDQLYVYGGHDLTLTLDDLWAYSFPDNSWRQLLGVGQLDGLIKEPVTVDTNVNNSLDSSFQFTRVNSTTVAMKVLPVEDGGRNRRTPMLPEELLKGVRPSNKEGNEGPGSLQGHGMVRVPAGLLLFGGKTASGSLSAALWLYNFTSAEWTRKASGSAAHPRPVWLHCVTLAGDWLYVFGGSAEGGRFLSDLYRIHVDILEEWELVEVRGEKEVKMTAHSCVFHPDSNSIISFGGLLTDLARFSKLSRKMFMFNINQSVWSEVKYTRHKSAIPPEMAFHTATLVGNYIVVFGGYIHQHGAAGSDRRPLETCYSTGLHLYSLECHCWQSREEEHRPPGHAFPRQQGVFGHSAALRHDSQLVVVGGYHGTVTGDLLGYTVPHTIARRHTPCQIYGSMAACMANPKCGWCGSNGTCHHYTDHYSHPTYSDMSSARKMSQLLSGRCRTPLETLGCPGICASMTTCLGCTVQGAGRCGWSPSTASCGRGHQGVKEPGDCAAADTRQGLTLSQYQHPPNMDQPDMVRIVNESKISFKYPVLSGEEITCRAPAGEEITCRAPVFTVHLQGTIRPPSIKDKKVKQLEACVKFANASLTIRAHTLSSQLSLSHPLPAGTALFPSCEDTAWTDGQAIFLIPTYSYSLNFQAVLSPSTLHSKQLSWLVLKDKAVPLTTDIDQLPTLELASLEPYHNGSCYSQSSCLGCLRDASCGWCSPASSCLPRLQQATCPAFLTTEPALCPACADLIYCAECAGDPGCEWLRDESRCLRRGRVAGAVGSVAACPAECTARPSCTSCLGEPGRCVWCSSTKSCFRFSVYTTEFQFGQCQQWLDRPPNTSLVAASSEQLCQACSAHTACSSCLASLGCGWCYSEDNPSVGHCMEGSYGDPKGQCQGEGPGSHLWEYHACPDIDECRLGLHQCHVNATCINLPGSYDCKCHRGFQGDGHSHCNKTCSMECRQGRCSGPPDYRCLCYLGWTGPDCSQDCGCHGHSTCRRGLGQCDSCQHLTTGPQCNQCQQGSYGDARVVACRPCHCNGHQDSTLGSCDPRTGDCYCRDATEGPRCDRCMEGFHGDPRHGGTCRFSCAGKTLITGVTEGALGLQPSKTGTPECLWIVSGVGEPDARTTTLGPTPVVHLRVEEGAVVECATNSLTVYDGLPPALAGPGAGGRQLAALCGHDLQTTRELRADSGLLSIVFMDSSPTEGFNATFVIGSDGEVESATDPPCLASGQCPCRQGVSGPDCTAKVQPSSDIIREDFSPMEAAPDTFARLGHTMVQDLAGLLWMFGGLNQDQGPLQDLRAFHPSNLSFRAVPLSSHQIASQPSARFFHAATFSPLTNSMYLLGGTNGHTTLSDFWRLDLVKLEWARLETRLHTPASGTADTWQKLTSLPSLAGHSLTYCPDTKSLVVIGGHSPEEGYNPDVLEYNLLEKRWQKMETEGFTLKGIYGHSTVYNQKTGSLYVFGGTVFHVNASAISNKLWTLHMQTKTWSLVPFSQQHSKALYHLENRLAKRFLHTAVTMGDYMVIIGGDSHLPGPSVLLVLSFSCLQWLRIPSLVARDIQKHMRQQGRFIGAPLEPRQAAAAAMMADGKMILTGGLARGRLQSSLTSLSLPTDFCRLFDGSSEDCHSLPGCAMCKVAEGNSFEDRCITANNARQLADLCPGWGEEPPERRSWDCSATWVSQEDQACSTYRSCGDCLATYPGHLRGLPWPSRCQWCQGCDQGGRCIARDRECNRVVRCYSHQVGLIRSGQCPELDPCAVPDCGQCAAPRCFWSRAVGHSSHQRKTVGGEAGGVWACENSSLLRHLDILNRSRPHHNIFQSSCPPACSSMQSCRACLAAPLTEAGHRSCWWSTRQARCLSPLSTPLLCIGGACGRLLVEEEAECPVACSEHQECASCLRHLSCGWCSHNSGSVSGRGRCTTGTLAGPDSGDCTATLLQNTTSPTGRNDSLSWHYAQCPLEDECNNGHHDCDPVSQKCEDRKKGYRCRCRAGYRPAEGACLPVCREPCQHGTCSAPDTCSCHFAWTGPHCQLACLCHGNSDCAGPDALSNCLSCKNHTKGSQCDACQPGYVGDPRSGGRCVPCETVCHGHSKHCYTKEALVSFRNSSGLLFDIPSDNPTGDSRPISEDILTELDSLAVEGPHNRLDMVCVNCGEGTRGPKCEACRQGTFRGSSVLELPCRPCFCNLHGDLCDPVTGGDCNCQNHTTTEQGACTARRAEGGRAEDCWQRQCGKCEEYYVGDPARGHQCYRAMVVDQDYCLNPEGSRHEYCGEEATPLGPGHTVYFAVQPKFMNVDIRVTIDISQGAADILLSAHSQMVVVENNRSARGVHTIHFDPQFGLNLNLSDYSTTEDTSDEDALFFLLPGGMSLSWRDSQVEEQKRLRRLIKKGMRLYVRNAPQLVSNQTIKPPHKKFHVRRINANGLSTFASLKNPNEVLYIKNVKHRLVIYLPETSHDLRSTKFYLVLHGAKTKNLKPTYGNIFFRQDQLHIDLFVFFSVFFSCFFLFLAGCVVFWKFKLMSDLRRARAQHVVEMTIMARRPFASQLLFVDREGSKGPPIFARPSPAPQPRRAKGRFHNVCLAHQHQQVRDRDSPRSRLLPEPPPELGLRAVVVEPTRDGCAAVTSVFVLQPGEGRLEVGSVLVQRGPRRPGTEAAESQ